MYFGILLKTRSSNETVINLNQAVTTLSDHMLLALIYLKCNAHNDQMQYTVVILFTA